MVRTDNSPASTIRVERHVTGRDPVALVVGHDLDLAKLVHDGDARVGGAEIDADDGLVGLGLDLGGAGEGEEREGEEDDEDEEEDAEADGGGGPGAAGGFSAGHGHFGVF